MIWDRPRVKTDRLVIRISPEDKELLRKAAKAERYSITDFVVDAARRRAKRILQK